MKNTKKHEGETDSGGMERNRLDFIESHAPRMIVHYLKAKRKHPEFCDWIGPNPITVEEGTEKRLADCLDKARSQIEEDTADGRLGWDTLLDCEIFEVWDALYKNDNSAAVEELYDAIAVLLRVVDVIEGRQKITQTAKGNESPQSEKHKPCKNRRRETRDGVTMDWCYAIGCCEPGDMPCEYCVDHPENYANGEGGKNED